MHPKTINNCYFYFIISALFFIVKAQLRVNYGITNMMDLPSRKDHVTHNVVLNFSNMNLQDISVDFISSPDVTSLILRNNNIKKLKPGTFNLLPNLEHLDLSNNDLNISDFMSYMAHQNLQSLILDHNCEGKKCGWVEEKNAGFSRTLVGASESQRKTIILFGNKTTFPNLRYLSLKNINVNKFFGNWSLKFPNLNHLDLSDNDFKNHESDFLDNIPKTIKILTMESVNLKSVNNIPSSVYEFEELNFSKNNFQTLSSNDCTGSTLCLKNLNKLKKLNISRCGIKKIEENAFENTQNVSALDLSYNEITEIPSRLIDQLFFLEKLDMSYNKLNQLPDISVSKVNLKYLSFKSNELNFISQSFLNKFPALEELDLSGNQINTLPTWLWSNNLRVLRMNNNLISNVNDLPLDNLSTLKLLDLIGNPIKFVSVKSFKQLPDYVVINLP